MGQVILGNTDRKLALGICLLETKTNQRLGAWGSIPIPRRNLRRERLVLIPRKVWKLADRNLGTVVPT